MATLVLAHSACRRKGKVEDFRLFHEVVNLLRMDLVGEISRAQQFNPLLWKSHFAVAVDTEAIDIKRLIRRLPGLRWRRQRLGSVTLALNVIDNGCHPCPQGELGGG